MNKIFLIIQREYLTRVRKRSFIVMTLLGPILMAALMIVPIYLAQVNDQHRKIAILDETGFFIDKIRSNENLQIDYVSGSQEEVQKTYSQKGYFALLVINKPAYSFPTSAVLYSEKQPGIQIKSYLEESMVKEIKGLKLQEELRQAGLSDKGIDKNILESIKTSVNIIPQVGEYGKEKKSYMEVKMVAGLFSAILTYFFVFMFGSQVMRGVIEEKTSRIVEVILSSVKPFQLMMGKIIGVALVGLTQFLLWVVLTLGIVAFFQGKFTDQLGKKQTELLTTSNSFGAGQADTLMATANAGENDIRGAEVFQAIGSLNFTSIILYFLFFFLGGYLLYAALFAAIGSAVDNEADTQQFMLPVTIPLILAIVMAQYVINNPDGPIAFWFSIIPFTSPVIMMIRIPFGVPAQEILLSMALLVLGFVGTTWLAAKIYRTGILLYGKKVDYRELWKWITYRG